MKTAKVYGLVVLLSVCAINTWGQVTRYVDINSANPVLPYTSWDHAAVSVNQAVAASFEGDRILVRDGTYTLTDAVVFTNMVLESVNGAAVTILVNTNYAGIFIHGADGLIKGFGITGQTTNAVGVVISDQAVMDACHVFNNMAVGTPYGVGGVYVTTDGKLLNSLVYSNTVMESLLHTNETLCGGVSLINGIMSNCQVYGCSALNTTTNGTAAFGGVYALGGAVYNSEINNNIAIAGAEQCVGGIMLYSSKGIWETRITENTSYCLYNGSNDSYSAGGISVESFPILKSTRVESCSVISNLSWCARDCSGYGVGGIYAAGTNLVYTTCVTRTQVSYNQSVCQETSLAPLIGGIMGRNVMCTNVDIVANQAVSGMGMAVGGYCSAENGHAQWLCIEKNVANAMGYAVGGVICNDSSWIMNSLVRGNEAGSLSTSVGGMTIEDSVSRSCLIADNVATGMASAIGGVLAQPGTMLECATVAGNVATAAVMSVGGAYVRKGVYRNTVFYGNHGIYQPYPPGIKAVGDGKNVLENGGGESYFWYCCFPSVNTVTNGSDMIYSSPEFVNQSGKNYRLQASSPCRNTGGWLLWMNDAYDVTGMPRLFGGSLDRGAYQYIAVDNDFDGDGRSDIGCYYAPGGNWYIDKSTDGFWTGTLGFSSTDPVTGDFDGDGLCDYGVYYPPSGLWEIESSAQGAWNTSFGYSGTVPVSGDFDGDGKSDFGCYYAPRGDWYIYRSSEGFWHNNFGYEGTLPVTGDFDGDGRCDFGCYYPPTGAWYVYASREGFWVNNFGYEGTVPVTGDFDGDGRCDFGCYYAPGGNWYVYASKDGFWVNRFGYSGTVAITGDYDGDGRCDFGCYYPPGGNWYVYKSSEGFGTTAFGYGGTVPIGR